MTRTFWLTGKCTLVTGALVLTLMACTSGGSDPAGGGGADGDLAGQLEGNAVWIELHQANMANAAASFIARTGSLPPADAQFVRLIEPSDYGDVLAECAREQGFGAQAMPDGGVKYDTVPEDQILAFEEAIYRCEVAYPTHPRFFEPWSDERVRATYDYVVNELVACLEAEGYPVAEAPPSFDTYLADFRAEDRLAWNPYSTSVDAPSEAEWRRINEACPQYPPVE